MIGRYELLTRLAMGGMAELFLARERGIAGLERLVVIKRILPHLADQESFVDMFLREARIVARLSHPNVVQIFDLGQEAESYHIAMEYIHGSTVRELQLLAAEQGVVTPHDVSVSIIEQACRGLQAAHDLNDLDGQALGLVHRDVSPHNLMCTPAGHVKLLDFGVAKATEGVEVTYSGSLKGKFAYLSPEQCLHQPLDRRSDVFALGICLWELCTGQRLFKRRTELEMMQAVIGGDVPSPRIHSRSLAPSIEKVILKALALKRDDRYASAEEMRRALVVAADEAGFAIGEDPIGRFVQTIAGTRLAERQATLQSAFERSLTSAERKRLLHMTGTGSRSDITRNEDAIGTVVDRPTGRPVEDPTVQYMDGRQRLENSGSSSFSARGDLRTGSGLHEQSSATGTADIGRNDDSYPSLTASQALEAIAGPGRPAKASPSPFGAKHFAIMGILIVLLLAGIVALWPGGGLDATRQNGSPVLIGEPLAIGWAPTVDPLVLTEEVRPLHQYLESATGRPMPLILAGDYHELSEMLQQGKIAFAVLPPLLYVRTKTAQPDIELLAYKEFDGGTSSDGLLLVHMRSNIRTLDDLEGKTFCFVDLNSTTGYFLPRQYIRDQGHDPDTFIGKIHWSGDHLQALRDLGEQRCDAAATYSGAFLSADSVGVPIGQIRQLAIIGHIPQDIVSSGPNVDPVDRQKVLDALVSFDPQKVLGIPRLGENQRITGFQAALDSDFDKLRAIVNAGDFPED